MTTGTTISLASETHLAWSDEPRETANQIILPEELLSRYMAIALRSAVPAELPGQSGHWVAELPRFPGVWADGDSPKNCLDRLEEVLRDWLILKILDKDRDIPVIDEIDLNTLAY